MSQNTSDFKMAEQSFLTSLVKSLDGRDLSQLDLKTLYGATHRAHSALFENYEINITRTPVFVHKNKFAKFFGIGDWRFQEGTFERYEIFVHENIQNTRGGEIIRFAGRSQIKTNNVIMARGTMATGRGYYLCSQRNLNISDEDETLYYDQNAHLFTPAKKLYNIFDTEYARRLSQIHPYTLSDLDTAHDYEMARARILDAVRSKVK